MLNEVDRLVDYEADRKGYPEGFPPFPGVSAERYYDSGFADAEMRYLWMRTWLFAAVESELPEPGSYMLFEQLGQSVIVIRGRDGKIRAFHNSCRHRASALLERPCGTVSRITCPYHSWTYGQEGQLLAVPMSRDFIDLEKSQRGLIPVRCETWRGLVFINFDRQAETLADFMAPTAGRADEFPLDTLVTKQIFSVPMECNWKLAYHNFLEAYHLAAVHPNSLGPHLDSDAFAISLYGNGHTRLAARKREGKSESIYKNEASDSRIGRVFRKYSITIPTFPNISAALDASGFAFQTFWPDGPRRSIMEVRLVGWPDSPDNDEYWSTMRTVADVILSEDLALFGRIQKGAESNRLPQLMMGSQEKALYWFEEEVDRRIGVENIPERMRVSQVLGDQVQKV